jgi:two-component system C4-dicarboxylate transport response regulator DctD
LERTLLVVDDHAPSREALRQWFSDRGWRVVTAADGWEALTRIKAAAFEVAIVDLDLPPVHGVALSGWDVVRIVRALAPRIVVLVLSAQGGDDARALADRLGVADLVEKPIGRARLHALAATLEAGIGRVLGQTAIEAETTGSRSARGGG